jgi:hypothetical protein
MVEVTGDKKPIIHHPGNLKPIETLNAWLSRDAKGNEGIMAVGVQGPFGITMMALVWSDRDAEPKAFIVEGARKEAQKLGLTLVRANFARVG